MHVIVAGAGVAGVVLAHALYLRGHTVDLLERQPQLRTALGGGFALSGALQCLKECVLRLERELVAH